MKKKIFSFKSVVFALAIFWFIVVIVSWSAYNNKEKNIKDKNENKKVENLTINIKPIEIKNPEIKIDTDTESTEDKKTEESVKENQVQTEDKNVQTDEKQYETESEKQDDTIQKKEEINQDVVNYGDFKLTAYCPCSKCCGEWSGEPTASGVMPKANHTIAVDKRIIPLGTKVIINGKTYVAEDTGGAIKGNRIDVYFNSHQEALNFGVKWAEVFVVK